MSQAVPTIPARPLGAKIGAYVALTKPRIIELLLVTTVPVMFLARRGVPSIWLMIATVIGGTLAAGGANAINMYVDRDIDAVMGRTQARPLVTGMVTPRAAITFAITIEAIAFVWLWAFANLLSALLALGATAFYVFVYTLWLKRTSSSNIVIGGAAGAAPVLIGWTAVTGHLAWAPWLLFAVIFMWTPPHFWALAVKYKDDYAAADVPMLPAVASQRYVGRQIVGYSVVLVGLTLLLIPVAHLGWIYAVTAVVAGGVFLGLAVGVLRTGSAKVSMRLFSYSITYVTILFAAMAIDAVVH